MSASCPYIVKRQQWVDGRLITEQKKFTTYSAALAYANQSGVDSKIYTCRGELVKYVKGPVLQFESYAG